MKHIIKVEVLENLPETRPLIAMDANGNLFWRGKTPTPVGPPNNEIWYTAIYQVIPTEINVFGANYLPEESTFDSSTQKGILKFDGNVTSIGDGAFYDCTGLTTVTIPNSVTSIGPAAFWGCSGLTSVTIPNSVTSIEWSAFNSCSGLTSIEIPNSVADIGNSAFSGCTGLTTVIIPNSVTSIGDYAFTYCSGLISIIVENRNSLYDSRNNCNAIIETATNTLIVGCNNTIIPNSVTSIGQDAFAGCSSLTSIEIPASVTSIGEAAFRDCTSLTTVTIPNSVTSIGKDGFYSCTGLTSVKCEATTPPTLDRTSVFNNTNNCPIYVPAQSVDAYKAATNWSTYASRIYAISE